jgi:glycosyltransferase involved in cell wall biosynthesis
MSVARAFSALHLAMSEQPDIVIGYHAPWNGIIGLLAGRLGRARTAYFSVGGPAEIVGGGLYSEHALFRRIGSEDPRLEQKFLELVSRFDSVLTMGSSSATWFRDAGITVPVWPMGAGVDGASFRLREPDAATGPSSRDFVTVARLAPIKRLDLLIQAIARLRDEGNSLSAVIVGEGSDRQRLEALIQECRLEANVTLAGFQSNVQDWLEPARLFVMTSASEGLPLAIIEAMLCGLPVVAPAIGDIPDLIDDGDNGFLFAPGDLDTCVAALRKAVSIPDPSAMSARARERALDYTVEARAALWAEWLASQRGARDA